MLPPSHVSGRALHWLGIPRFSELGLVPALLVADQAFGTTVWGSFRVGGAFHQGVIRTMKALIVAAAALAVVNGSARAESGIASLYSTRELGTKTAPPLRAVSRHYATASKEAWQKAYRWVSAKDGPAVNILSAFCRTTP